MKRESLLQIRELKTHFYTDRGVVRAVDGVSLDIYPGEIVGLLGESGSGKTALGLSINRLIQTPGKILDGSSIIFKGKELLHLGEAEMRKVRGKEIGMVFQDPMTYLNPTMKIVDQIAETLIVHKNIPAGEAKKEATTMLEMVQMRNAATVAKFYPHQLSGGMRQRVLLAIAMTCKPSLVIADEPTTALDTIVQAQILELVRGLKEKLGVSFMFISHDIGVISSICDRAYVMYAGKIVEGADTKSLFSSPRHHYTHALLTAAKSAYSGNSLMTVEGSVPDLVSPPSGCRFHLRCHAVHSKCQQLAPLPELTDCGHEFSCWRPIEHE